MDLILRNLFCVNTTFYALQMPVLLIFLIARQEFGAGTNNQAVAGDHQISPCPCFDAVLKPLVPCFFGESTNAYNVITG